MPNNEEIDSKLRLEKKLKYSGQKKCELQTIQELVKQVISEGQSYEIIFKPKIN